MTAKLSGCYTEIWHMIQRCLADMFNSARSGAVSGRFYPRKNLSSMAASVSVTQRAQDC